VVVAALMYLAALSVRRTAGPRDTASATEVEGLIHQQLLLSPIPEHHRIRHEEDHLTIACFLAGSGPGTEAQITEIHDLVRSALAGLPGWDVDSRP
jgi:hypothetical protein